LLSQTQLSQKVRLGQNNVRVPNLALPFRHNLTTFKIEYQTNSLHIWTEW